MINKYVLVLGSIAILATTANARDCVMTSETNPNTGAPVCEGDTSQRRIVGQEEYDRINAELERARLDEAKRNAQIEAEQIVSDPAQKVKTQLFIDRTDNRALIKIGDNYACAIVDELKEDNVQCFKKPGAKD